MAMCASWVWCASVCTFSAQTSLTFHSYFRSLQEEEKRKEPTLRGEAAHDGGVYLRRPTVDPRRHAETRSDPREPPSSRLVDEADREGVERNNDHFSVLTLVF